MSEKRKKKGEERKSRRETRRTEPRRNKTAISDTLLLLTDPIHPPPPPAQAVHRPREEESKQKPQTEESQAGQTQAILGRESILNRVVARICEGSNQDLSGIKKSILRIFQVLQINPIEAVSVKWCLNKLNPPPSVPNYLNEIFRIALVIKAELNHPFNESKLYVTCEKAFPEEFRYFKQAAGRKPVVVPSLPAVNLAYMNLIMRPDSSAPVRNEVVQRTVDRSTQAATRHITLTSHPPTTSPAKKKMAGKRVTAEEVRKTEEEEEKRRKTKEGQKLSDRLNKYLSSTQYGRPAQTEIRNNQETVVHPYPPLGPVGDQPCGLLDQEFSQPIMEDEPVSFIPFMPSQPETNFAPKPKNYLAEDLLENEGRQDEAKKPN